MEDFTKIDNYIISVDSDLKKDKMFRRFFITWNNPFWENQFEEIDINNTTLKFHLDKYNLEYYKKEFNKDLFEFKYIKYLNSKTCEDEIVERPFFKNVDAIKDYFVNLTNFKYSAFQIEKGGNSELTHIQALIIFKSPVNWSTFCNLFPLANFSDVYSSNTQARAYCTKEETRIDGPYEIGEFAEERSRTDVREFMELLDVGASDKDLKSTHPSLYLREFNKIDKIRNKTKFEEFRLKIRDTKVIYIYGPSRSGKTSYIVNKYGLGNFYNVDTYEKGPFDNYNGENIIVFDEYDSQINCTLMNKLIDRYPVQLPCRFENKWACYEKIYIISNLPLSEQYADENKTKKHVKDAFNARIDEVIRFDKFGMQHFEKQKETQQLQLIETEEKGMPF